MYARGTTGHAQTSKAYLNLTCIGLFWNAVRSDSWNLQDFDSRTHTAEMINPQVGKILDRSCQDCHSNRTAWPWYSHVAPVSWVISKHVNEGREMLDFSQWINQPPSANERMLICDAVSNGRMPLPGYTVIHRNARLSRRDVDLICEWAAAPSTPMTSMHVGKLTNHNE